MNVSVVVNGRDVVVELGNSSVVLSPAEAAHLAQLLAEGLARLRGQPAPAGAVVCVRCGADREQDPLLQGSILGFHGGEALYVCLSCQAETHLEPSAEMRAILTAAAVFGGQVIVRELAGERLAAWYPDPRDKAASDRRRPPPVPAEQVAALVGVEWLKLWHRTVGGTEFYELTPLCLARVMGG